MGALLLSVTVAGCGGSSSATATNGTAASAASSLAKQAENQAIASVAPNLQNAGVSPKVASQAIHGGLTCPNADRGADVGTATFTFNGANRISVTQDACPVIEALARHPELGYHGPGGCRGQFFVGDETTADPSRGLVQWFRYGARDAYLVGLGQVYHFVSAPRIVHGLLVFDQSFGTGRVIVTIRCPPPRRSGWLLPPGA